VGLVISLLVACRVGMIVSVGEFVHLAVSVGRLRTSSTALLLRVAREWLPCWFLTREKAMPYQPPGFPARCNVYDNGGGGPPRVVNLPCNMNGMNRDHNSYDFGFSYQLMYFPYRSDVRDSTDAAAGGDWVELPPGSGAFYLLLAVRDVARGYPNEFRIGYVSHLLTGGGGRRP